MTHEPTTPKRLHPKASKPASAIRVQTQLRAGELDTMHIRFNGAFMAGPATDQLLR